MFIQSHTSTPVCVLWFEQSTCTDISAHVRLPIPKYKRMNNKIRIGMRSHWPLIQNQRVRAIICLFVRHVV